MMSRRCILITCVFLSLFSCKNERRSSPGATEEVIPVIDIGSAMDRLSSKKINFSEFVEDITYVPLETTDESIAAGNKSRLLPEIVTEKHIFYGEAMYGRDGSFIRKLGKTGQGPEEYVLAIDVDADEERREFYVSENFIPYIYVYDFDNNFKRKVPTPSKKYSCGITALGNGRIIITCDNTLINDLYEYMVLDANNGEVLFSRSSGISKEQDLRNLRNMTWCHNGKASYYEASTDTIFNLKENGETGAPRYTVNMGKYKYNYPGDEKMVRITNIEESRQYLFFNVSRNNPSTRTSTLYYGAYNKQTGETVINKFDQFFNNDIDGGFLWLFNGVSGGNEGFRSVFPYIAKERIEMLSSQNRGYDKAKNQKLRELIDSVEDEDDQIFYFYKLK